MLLIVFLQGDINFMPFKRVWSDLLKIHWVSSAPLHAAGALVKHYCQTVPLWRMVTLYPAAFCGLRTAQTSSQLIMRYTRQYSALCDILLKMRRI